jgi:Flp pilus assembly protein TadD
MKKLIATTAVVGLLALAAACSSKSNQGGTSENQSYTNPSQTGGEMGTPQNQNHYQAPANGSETQTNNASQGQGGTSFTPGGTSSGYGTNANQNLTPENNNNSGLPQDNGLNNTTNENNQNGNNPPPQ